MKRTETTKLKSKGIKPHIPSNYHAHSFYKYNRYYVAAHYGDANHVPFNCGCRRAMRMFWDENPNVRLWGYLNRYMHMQIGRKMDEVFSEFSKLGWKTTKEMFHYWSGFTESRCQEYYADKEGYMRFFPYSPYREDKWYRNLLDNENYYDDWDDFDEDDEEDGDDKTEYLLKYARKPSSEKRLVRQYKWRKNVNHTKI